MPSLRKIKRRKTIQALKRIRCETFTNEQCIRAIRRSYDIVVRACMKHAEKILSQYSVNEVNIRTAPLEGDLSDKSAENQKT